MFITLCISNLAKPDTVQTIDVALAFGADPEKVMDSVITAIANHLLENDQVSDFSVAD